MPGCREHRSTAQPLTIEVASSGCQGVGNTVLPEPQRFTIGGCFSSPNDQRLVSGAERWTIDITLITNLNEKPRLGLSGWLVGCLASWLPDCPNHLGRANDPICNSHRINSTQPESVMFPNHSWWSRFGHAPDCPESQVCPIRPNQVSSRITRIDMLTELIEVGSI